MSVIDSFLNSVECYVFSIKQIIENFADLCYMCQTTIKNLFFTGLTPLHVVAIVGNENIFKTVMENTGDIQLKNGRDSRTPYHFAAEMGHFGYYSAHP